MLRRRVGDGGGGRRNLDGEHRVRHLGERVARVRHRPCSGREGTPRVDHHPSFRQPPPKPRVRPSVQDLFLRSSLGLARSLPLLHRRNLLLELGVLVRQLCVLLALRRPCHRLQLLALHLELMQRRRPNLALLRAHPLLHQRLVCLLTGLLLQRCFSLGMCLFSLLQPQVKRALLLLLLRSTHHQLNHCLVGARADASHVVHLLQHSLLFLSLVIKLLLQGVHLLLVCSCYRFLHASILNLLLLLLCTKHLSVLLLLADLCQLGRELRPFLLKVSESSTELVSMCSLLNLRQCLAKPSLLPIHTVAIPIF
mmetsp:Transcript_48167/g.98394  ORF Transcript_48167/g.98394 Transcript_48167/m.98394 type:complete len:310 (-) Transcript_48167:236-1165(-)